MTSTRRTAVGILAAGLASWLMASGAAVTGVTATGVRLAAADDSAQVSGPVLVFAAASMQTALDAQAAGIRRDLGIELRTSYAATSALARQIEQGAPADIFVSADLDWMDYLQQRGAIRAATRVNLVGNRLVLIAPAGSPVALRLEPGVRLADALGDGRLAVADPAAVPAGRYARAALESLGVWTDVAPHLAAAENVRSALLLVARRETPLGIVYRTDALADRSVRVVGTFPVGSHAPIVYPAAVTTGAPHAAAAERVLVYLRGAAARRVFEEQGFELNPPTTEGQPPPRR